MNALIPLATAWLNKQLETISLIKDKILVLAGLIYLIGYAIWTFHSWINNLGLLPPLQLQYFVAGSASIIILAVAKGIWDFENWFLKEKWPAFVGAYVTGWKSVLRNVIPIINVISLFGWLTSQMLISYTQGKTEKLAIILFYVFSISLVLHPPDLEIKDRWWRTYTRFVRKITLGFLPFFIVLAGMLIFYIEIYPTLPQELGGVKPKCAFLDIEKNKLFAETLDAILPSSATVLDNLIVRSVKVDVYYSAGGALLIKPNHTDGGKTFTTYEIEKSAIEVITWCP